MRAIGRLMRLTDAKPGTRTIATVTTASLMALVISVVWYGATHASGALSQAGSWSLLLDRPYPGKYEDFAFPNARHGWLTSSAGDILHSADSGATWVVQATAVGRLRSIDFIDEKRGFAGSINGQLFGTTDGGTTWQNITSSLPRPTLGFCGITHVGDKVHIVGKYTGGAADYYYSPDGGKTWSVTSLGNLAQGLVDVSFISESVGFIGGMAKAGDPGSGPAVILKTTDGGRNWRPVFQHDGGRGFAWKIFPMSATLLYASLQSQDGIYRIAKSTNGGEKWEVLTVATGRATGPAIQGVGFIDENTGWVGGFFEGMYQTTDGGRTWKAVTSADRSINRFERVGGRLFTASRRGVLRYAAPAK
jgi:photosystem II stability/assembly factor-like uncharacterized protein